MDIQSVAEGVAIGGAAMRILRGVLVVEGGCGALWHALGEQLVQDRGGCRG